MCFASNSISIMSTLVTDTKIQCHIIYMLIIYVWSMVSALCGLSEYGAIFCIFFGLRIVSFWLNESTNERKVSYIYALSVALCVCMCSVHYKHNSVIDQGLLKSTYIYHIRCQTHISSAYGIYFILILDHRLNINTNTNTNSLTLPKQKITKNGKWESTIAVNMVH